ncbi:2-hydroxyacid dehydrogenase [Acuticoccus kandeliae]|uniref:2-hydroxyacid dehydrogenase n=1 Tax=Acuticoccus kandeliae TaxID=2073160 RepID=UPI000D3E07B0|nr:D-glycerate dehydrogenase [Acuticoccus kandeliae]
MGDSVIVTRRLPETVEARMRQLFDVRLNESDRPLTQAELVQAVREARVLVPTITDRIDASVLEQAGPDLGLIANYGAGTDHIDLDAASAREIDVSNTPGVLTEDTADMTMALILSLPRRVVEGVRVIEEQRFPGWSPTWMLGHRVSGKRIGIVGMGRIGAAVARRARAFGMAVHYHNRRPAAQSVAEPLGATYWQSLDQMLARMDFVSIHCPHTPATFHLLSARRLALMRPECILVNLARGEIVDEEALIRQLEAGALAGAALDVFERRPAIDERLLKLAREGKALLLPHMGSATIEGRIDMGEKVIVNIRTFLDGHRPPDLVLPHSGGVHPTLMV